MCYLIKSKQRFNFYSMTVAIEKKNVDIDRLKVWPTSNYDFFGATQDKEGSRMEHLLSSLRI